MSAIHELILQPEEFELVGKFNKPGAKLGDTLDNIENLLHSDKEFESFDELVKEAAIKADYYTNCIEAKIPFIKDTWKDYAPKLEEIRARKSDKNQIILSDSDYDVVTACVDSLKSNEFIMSKLHPVDVFGDPIQSYCEDAFFMDYIITYQGKQCSILRFKLKIDNWTIDFDNKIVTLNDLKTTSGGVNNFMEDGHSFLNFHYYRQFLCYSTILWKWLMKTYGITKDSGWTMNCNVCVVETIPNYWSRSFVVNDYFLRKGQKEFNELLKRVAACEIFGYDKEYIFE